MCGSVLVFPLRWLSSCGRDITLWKLSSDGKAVYWVVYSHDCQTIGGRFSSSLAAGMRPPCLIDFTMRWLQWPFDAVLSSSRGLSDPTEDGVSDTLAMDLQSFLQNPIGYTAQPCSLWKGMGGAESRSSWGLATMVWIHCRILSLTRMILQIDVYVHVCIHTGVHIYIQI